MAATDRAEIARKSYLAFAAGDRGFFEARLSDDLAFSSPPDPHLDRAGWFAKCWPAAGTAQQFDFVRVIDAGDAVIVTYDLRRPDGSGGRNTEVLTFDNDDKIVRIEVYFGWDLQ
jgi:ketosteroid isomerase-like protein